MEYKDRIKAARKHAKLTQDTLAEAVGIKQASISELETGKSLSSSFNASIAKACGVDAVWLETGRGRMLVDASNVDPGLDTTPGETARSLLDTSTLRQDAQKLISEIVKKSETGELSVEHVKLLSDNINLLTKKTRDRRDGSNKKLREHLRDDRDTEP